MVLQVLIFIPYWVDLETITSRIIRFAQLLLILIPVPEKLSMRPFWIITFLTPEASSMPIKPVLLELLDWLMVARFKSNSTLLAVILMAVTLLLLGATVILL